ncbi:MAG: phospholipase D-like domain-containing protein [Cellulomonadaceae bacterium]
MSVSLVLLALHVVLGFVAAVAISLRRTPATAIAWILTIVFIPVPSRSCWSASAVSRGTAVTLNRNLGALPMVAGNTARLLEDYDGSFAAMVADIDEARDHVHVEFYILVLDEATRPLFDALARAVARGVRVLVLSDHVSGFMFPGRRRTRSALAAMGAEWRPMLPLRPWRLRWQRPALRNHRKIVVVDGRVGYTGSQNLIDASYLKSANRRRRLHWVELMVRLEGPVVGELDAVFVTDWFSETGELLPVDSLRVPDPSPAAADVGRGAGALVRSVDAQVVPSGPSFENDNNLKLFVLLIQNARRRVSITSPYFVPDESTLLAIVTAASRGLEVELFVSEVADQPVVHHAQRSYYAALLDAGVAIHQYRAPAVLHAKHFTIDEDVAVIGSSNMDIRSFSLNMEVSVLVRSRELVDRLRLVEDHYRANSVPIDAKQWSARPVPGKVLDGLARLTSALQ